jgi:N-acetylmuramoyl-L-alanine amidase
LRDLSFENQCSNLNKKTSKINMLQSIFGILYTYKRSAFLILACILFLSVLSQKSYAQTQEDYRLRKVVIDAGHGGKDPGAIGAKSQEKDIVLAIALKLGKYIEENHKDVEVIYTRKEDVFVEVFRRADIANENNADLFISIHANAHANKRAFGTETYAMGLHTSKENLEVARKENKAILFEENYEERYEGYDPNSPESFIVFSLMQNSFLYQSLDFASHIQNQFTERVKRFNRGVKQAGFLVLWRTTMPSVLIEVGFISNPDEEKFLMSDEGQTHLASAIYRAFRDYKESIEKKSNGSKPVVISQRVNQTEAAPVIRPNHSATEITNKNEVFFRVQVSASSTQTNLDSELFHGMEHATEFFSNGIYRYTVGLAKTMQEAVEMRKKINARFPDAFLVASQGGKLISVQEAMKQLNP